MDSKNPKGFENQRFSRPRKTKFSAGFENSLNFQNKEEKPAQAPAGYVPQLAGVPARG